MTNLQTWLSRAAFSTLWGASVFMIGCSDSGTDKTGDGGDVNPPTSDTTEVVGEINSDLWAATDPLGRKLPTKSEAGDKRSNKYVAMFYWTWHNPSMVDYGSVGNISQIIKQYPDALTNKDHPAWNRGGSNTHFWGQPLMGYYRTTDTYVLRKHAELLADAGVDVVFFDCTNAPFLWDESYTALLATWDKARQQGVNVPKVAFMFPFGPSDASYSMLKTLYAKLYKAKKYPNMWFYWKGKPLIMAYNDNIPDDATGEAIKNFFTFRPGQPDYVNGPSDAKQWGWLEIYPQHKYGYNEEVPVGVAQNTSAKRYYHAGAFNVEGALGRSYRGKTKSWDNRTDSYLWGANFQEQWDYAIQQDPYFVFVTGWNEYIAGKWDRGTTAGDVWDGYPFSFVDEYDWEHSRDIEPNAEWYDANGNYRGDTYYYQLIQNVRKFKGVSKFVYASKERTIKLGEFNWKGVAPDFRHYKGNNVKRSSKGHADTYYTSTLGRNDIVDAKVARDADNFYFYVETASTLTAPTDPNWMWLMIDIDRNKATGWEGYDYILNYLAPASGKGTLSKNKDNKWSWESAGSFDYAIKGNKMEIKVPRTLLGMGASAKINFEFKWVDNMPDHDNANAAHFYTCGDAAPGARFNFIYTVQ